MIDFGEGQHEVEVVDALFLALSPWALRTLRFDESRPGFRGFHGYDADICCEARRRGKRVVVTEIDLVHHTRGGLGDQVAYRRADITWQRKWRRNVSPWQRFGRTSRYLAAPVLGRLRKA